MNYIPGEPFLDDTLKLLLEEISKGNQDTVLSEMNYQNLRHGFSLTIFKLLDLLTNCLLSV